MLPNYVVPETTVRETGESDAFPLGETSQQDLRLTLGITHAMEQESLDLDVFVSNDGSEWQASPLVRFRQKFFCGTYQMDLPASGARFLKAVWHVDRWGHSSARPFFRIYLYAEIARAKVMAGVA